MFHFLSSIFQKLDTNLPAVMAVNMVACVTTTNPTLLHISLGVVIRGKTNIELLHNFSITSSYDEVLHFNSSAAHAAAKIKEKLIIPRSDVGNDPYHR